MSTLLLLNGPPASGKSTLGARLVSARPLALNLDIDVVRAQLGSWLDYPRDAGLAARALALTMARTHLRSGHDVVVPQLLARVDFIEDLERLASEVGASFVEVLLDLDRASAIEAFQARRRRPQTQAHLDAAALIDRSEEDDPLGTIYEALQRVADARTATRRVPVERGNVAATMEALLPVLHDAGVSW